MKNKLITILIATGIIVAIITATIIIGVLCCLSNYLCLSMAITAFVYGICYFYRLMRLKERYYFVSYSHKNGFGNCIARVEGTFSVTEISKRISDPRFECEGDIVILYYKEISEEEYKDNQS